ncbi:aminoglycoside phosphotransferase family protein [Evansella cellulosilytica]|uniref:Aminoglycoside/hydroxyurea antibiotic resistance kinase n=1 Tax=Evansella cellulosilytica (strain ATCC 21833 / DSM 2522 / FERM P-1141 / JCM 9156 / N-4) TaxID=649639 RepID=E6TV02_EVAC2|nr:aminoglycoside phosphotransferase family protein [Evansella cellulosilytica]ADU28585.1 aminoglycoside/hydroxyurea antibiotic resistance kinase [Evansella cellulosilytica DSM 2522]
MDQSFQDIIVGVHGEKGKEWLTHFSTLKKEVEDRFEINIEETFKLSYNFVAKAVHRKTKAPVVVKMGVPNEELTLEMLALQAFNGRGAISLIDKDDSLGAFLLPYIQGEQHGSLTNVEATIAVMKDLPIIEKQIDHFPTVHKLFQAFHKHRVRNGGTSGVIDPVIFHEAERMVDDLLSSEKYRCLLHGDLHGGNIMHDRLQWIMLDPKGVAGEREFEPAQFFLNAPLDLLANSKVMDGWLRKFESTLHLERNRVLAWAFCKGVLSSVWSIESNEQNWQWAIKRAEIIKSYM